MSYEKWIRFSRKELIEKLQSHMSERRFQHVLGVELAARKLAERFGVDTEKAGLAGLLHDYAKEMPDEIFLKWIDQKKCSPQLKKWGNNIWHGMVGIYQIQADLQLTDPEILRAIEIHTVGAANMTGLDKVLYVADYIEAGRKCKQAEVARALAHRSLDAAVAYETAQTIAYLVEHNQPIYPQTIETYNAFCSYLVE